VVIPDDAETNLLEAAKRAVPRETGGLLLGYFEPTAIVVRQAIEVVDPEATATSYTRQQARAQKALDVALLSLDSDVGYVGDWHSHPGFALASWQDKRELRRAAAELELPLAMIVVRVHRGDVKIQAHVDNKWCH
jgi:integrative and conjugative element protein (TIGR02256 family)